MEEKNKVELAPGAIEALQAIKLKNFVLAEVATLTDDQLEQAVYNVDPERDDADIIAGVFLRELAKRDEKRAFLCFKKWKERED